jgi:hypothetical protein
MAAPKIAPKRYHAEEAHLHKNQEQPMSGRLRPGLIEDVYVVLAGWDTRR